MSSLPDLVTARLCGATATVRIEGYSARYGLAHGSLDVIVYACAEHAAEARTEWLSGLTPYNTATAPDSHRCGDRVDFTAEGVRIHAADAPTSNAWTQAGAREVDGRGPVAKYVESVVDAWLATITEYLWNQPESALPTGAEWTMEGDCGPCLVRVSIKFEPTGRTREQAEAASLADDQDEALSVREAARAVAAGGPGIAAAREALRHALAIATATESGVRRG